MSERINTNQPERESSTKELEEARREQLDKLKKQHEELEKRSPERENSSEQEARLEAMERAKEKEPARQEQTPLSPAERRIPSKERRDEVFNTTMKEVRSQMSAPSRIFSKVIHNKIVEKTSEVVGGTVARPNALLSGAIFAFLLTLGVYIIAKNFGYPLSGFETIAAFIAGWVIGIAYDFIKIMVTGRK